MELLGHVFSGLRHGFHAVQFFQFRIDETPAHSGVFNFLTATKRTIGFAHHIRCARHGFHAAGNDEVGLACFDGTRRHRNRVQRRAAQTVDRGGRHLVRQACEQGRHATDIAVVFAALVGTAINHIVYRFPIHTAVAFHQCLNRQSPQIIGTHTRQFAAIAAKRGADCINYVSVFHLFFLGHLFFWVNSLCLQAAYGLMGGINQACTGQSL